MKPWASIAFWIVVAGQLVFLIGFISVKETALRSGAEVVLQTVPVDPRSLLQGDYAILDYEIADLPPFLQDHPVGETAYVVLDRGARGLGSRAIRRSAAARFPGCSSRAGLTAMGISTSASARSSSPKEPATSSKARVT